MKFKYELHSHTGPVSVCASIDPKELVWTYWKNGYDGMVLTDHYSPMTFYKHILSPEKHIEDYLKSYRILKEYCGKDFTIMLGLELRHYGTVNDYLVYGVEEDWLMNQGNMLMWNEKKMCEEIHKQGYLIYQAHPYRPFIKRCPPEYIDGIEIFNGHTDAQRNEKALIRATKLDMPFISGSDFHSSKDKPCGGIITDYKIRNNKDLLRTLKNGAYEVITPEWIMDSNVHFNEKEIIKNIG